MNIIIFTVILLLSLVNSGALTIQHQTSPTNSSSQPSSEESKDHEVLYHLIFYNYGIEERKYKAFCSGALVKLDTIITSADCLENWTDEINIFAGFADNLEQGKSQSSSIYYASVDWVKFHPDWWESLYGSGTGNLAVIKLKTPFAHLKDTKEIHTIPLVDWFDSYIDSDSEITISGISSDLNTNRLEIYHPLPFSSKRCRNMFGTDKLCTQRQKYQNQTNRNYNNGGPLVVKSWAGDTLYGISLGFEAGVDEQSIEIYTDLWYYNEWLSPLLITSPPAIAKESSEPISGRITSPNHPYNYNPNSTITWEILAPVGHRVRITLEHLDLEVDKNLSCYDYLSIKTMDIVPISLFRGCRISNQYSAIIISPSNQISIRFYSDAWKDSEGTGFSLFYESFTDETGPPIAVPNVSFFTGDNFTGNSLNSPIQENECVNFPSQYSGNVSSVDPGERCIILYMRKNCEGIFVEVYPGSSENQLKLSPEFENKVKSYSPCLFSNRGRPVNTLTQSIHSVAYIVSNEFEFSIPGFSFTHPDKYMTKGRNMFILTDANFDKAVLRSEFPWLVSFAAPSWCGHSARFLPMFKEIATKLKGTAFSGWLDTDDNDATYRAFPITRVPRILYFPGRGQPYEIYTQMRSVDEIVDWVKQKVQPSKLFDE